MRGRGGIVILGMAAMMAVVAGTALARSEPPPAVVVKADRVVVYKTERRLVLMRGDTVLGAFPIALGPRPRGHKLREGDGRTPEGLYVLDRRNPVSRFYRAIHISYPAPADRERAARHGVAPGGDIMIHGLPRRWANWGVSHAALDWTNGCIAVSNAEMDEIWARVDDGTAIDIRP